MKFINYKNITPLIAGFYIDSFDIPGDADDIVIFEKIISGLFHHNDRIFFMCSGKEQESSEDSLKAINEYFDSNGTIVKIEAEETKEISYLAGMNYSDTSPGLIVDLWKFFRHLAFFKPASDLTWESFTGYGKNLLDEDPDKKKMFTFNFMDFVLVKGSGGESLILNYRMDYPLPDIYSLVKE